MLVLIGSIVACIIGAVSMAFAFEDRNEARGLLVGMPGMFILLMGMCGMLVSIINGILFLVLLL